MILMVITYNDNDNNDNNDNTDNKNKNIDNGNIDFCNNFLVSYNSWPWGLVCRSAMTCQ